MDESRSLRVTLETVTPLFLGGAEPRGAPELRAPSFRGAMRYWLRAALGGVMGDADLETLKRAESEVFGSTDGAGAVVVRVNWKDKEPSTIRQNILPHPSAARPARLQGYPANEAFEIQMVRRGSSERAWLCAVGALLLLVSHGGLGKRVRRGWGSLCIAGYQVKGGDLPLEISRWLQITEIRSPQEWISYQQNLCRAVAQVCKGLVADCKGTMATPRFPSRFPIVMPQSQRFVWKDSFPNWLSAISEFGEREHQFLEQNPEYANAFGFAKGRRRQASPLWVRVFPVRGNGEKKFFVGMCLLEPRFRESNYDEVRRFIELYPVASQKGGQV